jgi:hypothetical protein
MSTTSRRHSISSDQYMLSPVSQGSPSQISSRLLQSRINGSTRPLSSVYPISSAGASHAYDHPSGFHHPSLAPAPPITSSKRRSTVSRVPPPLSSLNHSSHSGRGLYHPPLTPTNGIQGIRNQAEQDAVDTLLFMSSPVNSGNMKWAASAGSPVRGQRTEFEKSSDMRYS